MRLQLKKLPKIVQGYAWLRVALVKNNITYSPWCIPHLKVPTCCRACRERERQQKLFRKCCAREQYENSATRRQPGRTFVSKTWLKLNISPRACRKQFNWRWATERSVVNRTSDRRSKLVKICEKKKRAKLPPAHWYVNIYANSRSATKTTENCWKNKRKNWRGKQLKMQP